MINHRYSTLLILLFLLAGTLTFAQTKAERKMKAKSLNTGMYNGSESEEANRLYEQGSKLHAAEDYKGAIKIYEKVLKEDPKFVETYDNIAVCYRRLGDLKNAIKYYQQSIELYPEGAMAHQNLGLVYAIQKEYDKSIAEYEICQKLYPDDPEGYYGTIQSHIAKNDFENAIKNASKTLELYEATNSPYLSDVQYLLGLSYYYNKDNKKAKVYIEQAKKSGVNVPAQLLKELDIK